jgi:serine/threonine-protein kinase
MDAERWRRIEELFNAAVELSPNEWPPFLAAHCGADVDLAREVAALLAVESGSGDMIYGTIEAATRKAALPQSETPSERIGPYRLLREIGHGGMGTVYLAERDDAQYKAQVAIKLVRGGLRSAELTRRFIAERQILADLNHPNIARLLDGGATADGTPYLVMEYVEGEPIDVFCDARNLGLDARIDLVRTICAAVQHAHQSLVVHRDIKPSNILVTVAGVPKLVDFGIAKLLEGDGDAAETTAHLRLMTPSYASPEQLRGERITAATDTYSLGVVLYRLLAGKLPFDVAGLSAAEIERRITQESPQPPSVCAQSRRLAGDLDNIVLKALSKEPQRRYHSVAEFSADLGRHLAYEPVLAQRDSWRYRTGKFVRRHRTQVGVASAIVILLSAFTLYHTDRLSTERDRAQAAAVRAQRVAGFLTRLFEQADPSATGGQAVSAQTILDRGAARIDEELANEPEVRATLKQTIAHAYRYLGLHSQAERIASEVLSTRERLFGPESPEVAEALSTLAAIMFETSAIDTVETLTRRSLAIRRKRLAPNDSALALSLNDVGWVTYAQGKYPAADSLHREALAIRRGVFPAGHDDVAESLDNLGAVRYEFGDFAGADTLQGQALAMRTSLHGSKHRMVSRSLANVAVTKEAMGNYVAAESLLKASLEVDRAVYGDRHVDQAATNVNLGRVLGRLGRYDEAELHTRRAAALDSLRGPMHPFVAYDLRSLGDILRAKKDYVGAVHVFREALRIYKASPASGEASQAPVLTGLGVTLVEAGQAREGEASLREALLIWERTLPAGHPRIATLRTHIGVSLTAQKRYAAAESLLVRGFDELRRAESADSNEVRSAQQRLLRLYEAWGKNDAADRIRSTPISRDSTTG